MFSLHHATPQPPVSPRPIKCLKPPCGQLPFELILDILGDGNVFSKTFWERIRRNQFADVIGTILNTAPEEL
jgi:hypothetical protein